MKKKRKIRRSRGTNPDRMYFTQETEDAIVEYNFEKNDKKRNIIYNTRIQKPLYKLIENIFNTFKFSYFDVGPQKVMEETLTFVTSQLHKYDHTKGKKAYSYFSTVVKHNLIYKNNNFYKKFKQHTVIEDCNHEEKNLVVDHEKDKRLKDLNEFLDLTIDYWDENIEKLFKKVRDQKIAFAVMELFRRRGSLENFNKKALYLYIREMTGCKTQYITKVVNKMKETQSKLARQYLDYGHFSPKDDF